MRRKWYSEVCAPRAKAATSITVTIFDDEEQSLASNDIAAEFVREHLALFQIERLEVFGGEVMVSRAAEKVLVPARH
jgi:hypothetical protein